MFGTLLDLVILATAGLGVISAGTKLLPFVEDLVDAVLPEKEG